MVEFEVVETFAPNCLSELAIIIVFVLCIFISVAQTSTGKKFNVLFLISFLLTIFDQ